MAAPEAQTPTKKAEIVIEVHVDYVCPWCYIGTERLDRAIAASGLADRVVVRRRPFLLDPDLLPEGVDLAERLRKKYGGDPEQMFERVENVARSVGLTLDFTKQRRTYPTSAAHALMAWLVDGGASEATQRAVERELFETHFVKAGNIASLETLVEIGSRHGQDAASVRAALSDPATIEGARKAALAASAQGVRGVPHFRFPTGEVISGAQQESMLEAAIRKSANL
jgi:predicted DsbA family dithiol-disulfide isomerase